MRKSLRSSPALRVFGLVLLSGFSLLTGCGKVSKRLRGWYSHAQRVRARLLQPRVQEEPNEPHSVTMSWVASKSPVAGYNVYREFQHGGPVKLTPQIIPGTQYTDTTVKRGRTYSYYVTSVDSKGTESAPSERITVTVPIGAVPAAKQ